MRLTSVKLQATVLCENTELIHEGLKRLYSESSARGVPPDSVDKLKKMFAYLDNMEDAQELRALAAWGSHA